MRCRHLVAPPFLIWRADPAELWWRGSFGKQGRQVCRAPSRLPPGMTCFRPCMLHCGTQPEVIHHGARVGGLEIFERHSPLRFRTWKGQTEWRR